MASGGHQLEQYANSACGTQYVSGAVYRAMGIVDGSIGGCADTCVDRLFLRPKLDYQRLVGFQRVEGLNGNRTRLQINFEGRKALRPYLKNLFYMGLDLRLVDK